MGVILRVLFVTPWLRAAAVNVMQARKRARVIAKTTGYVRAGRDGAPRPWIFPRCSLRPSLSAAFGCAQAQSARGTGCARCDHVVHA